MKFYIFTFIAIVILASSFGYAMFQSQLSSRDDRIIPTTSPPSLTSPDIGADVADPDSDDIRPIISKDGSASSVYTRNSTTVFYNGTEIEEADPHSFRLVLTDDPAWALDGNHVYLRSQIVPQADPTTFETRSHDLAFFFASDSKNLFFVEYQPGDSVYENTAIAKLVPGADVNSVVSDGYEQIGSSFDQPSTSIFRVHDNNQTYTVRQVRIGCRGDYIGCIVSTTLTILPK